MDNTEEFVWVTPAKRQKPFPESPPPSHDSPLVSSSPAQAPGSSRASGDPTPSSPSIGPGPRLLFPESNVKTTPDSPVTPSVKKKPRVTLEDLTELMAHVDALEADVAVKAGRIKSLELTKEYLRDSIAQLKEQIAAPCSHCGTRK